MSWLTHYFRDQRVRRFSLDMAKLTVDWPDHRAPDPNPFPMLRLFRWVL